MSPVTEVREQPTTGFPRVSGDEPRTLVDWALAFRFSPRERG